MSDRIVTSSFHRIPGKALTEEQRLLSESEAFLLLLENCPLDNRRRGENFRDTYVEVRPKPPRNNVPYLHGTEENICKISEQYLRLSYPGAFERYGALNVRLKLLERIGEMERIRREGRAPKEGAKTANSWNPGV